ncbi:MAG: DNA cytosine methyltransferase [Alphaproteobacteria bacterium]|nr:DNA cytosine methyltransferase [Alphaproteobacteria bacterium]
MKSKSKQLSLNAIDLFAGCGGLTQGMHDAGFTTKVAVEIEPIAAEAYGLNHPATKIITKNIREVHSQDILSQLDGEPLHLLAGCPPCQGFSSVRRLNRKKPVEDHRNDLVLQYLRLVKELNPLTIMMENVPALIEYEQFKIMITELKDLGYNPKVNILNVKDFEVPQNRRRLVLIGSRLAEIDFPPKRTTKLYVRDAIYFLPLPELSDDHFHRIQAKHSDHVMRRIELTPHDGGSRKDLPAEYILDCHKKTNVGFHDIYGRLRWDDYSTTITGGCLNPSKGRFLHPEQNRCISPREAAILQSFPADYKFPPKVNKSQLSLLIGNALPPKFSYYQSLSIAEHLQTYL